MSVRGVSCFSPRSGHAVAKGIVKQRVLVRRITVVTRLRCRGTVSGLAKNNPSDMLEVFNEFKDKNPRHGEH